jgi:large subunit ribosomal protein L28
MATGFKCYNCGKGVMVGHNVSHAKNRIRKVFRPNLHSARIKVSGTSMRVRLCTKCLRQYKNPKVKGKAGALKTEAVSSIPPVATGLV